MTNKISFPTNLQQSSTCLLINSVFLMSYLFHVGFPFITGVANVGPGEPQPCRVQLQP